MNEEVLFQITKQHLETGLRGIPVGYCTTSTVYPDKGLYYVDHPIEELAYWQPEKVIFLLYHGYDGKEKEVSDFAEELKRRSKCSDEALNFIRKLPRRGHPMALYSAALLILGMYEATGDYRQDCLNLIAKIPELTAVLINHHAGWKEKESKAGRNYIENFTDRLGVSAPDLVSVLPLFNILHYDHGGGNLSTFVGKAVASGLEDLYGSIAAAMNALAGPLHGRANQECLQFVKELSETLGLKATEEDVEKCIREKLVQGKKIYGFGHAVLRVEDPRATVQYKIAQERYPNHPLVKMALFLRSAGAKVLKENPKITNPYPNVDAISGTLLTAAGFPHSEYYTVLFGMSRVVGIAIQIVYERCEARGGKGTPIVRPKYLYKPHHQKDI